MTTPPAIAGTAPARASRPTYFTDCVVIDVETSHPLEDAVVVVEDGSITNVGARSDFPESLDGDEVRLWGGYVLPGLFNCHAHLALDGSDVPYAVKLPVLRALDEGRRIAGYLREARLNLAWGVTSVRDLHPGPAGTLDGYRLVRELSDGSSVAAARLFMSGRPLVVPGGHGTHWLSRVVSGPDDVVRAVRETIADGADVVKLMTAHAWGPLPGVPASWATYFTPAELAAAVATAHGFGVPVAAHCHGEQALKSVVAAGVDSVEHGSGMTPSIADQMAAQGTYLVPTLASYDNISTAGAAGGLDEGRLAQAAWVRGRQRTGFDIARRAGVRIAAGSDAGFHMLAHGESLIRELELYVELGMSPIEAIRSATTTAAALVGVRDSLGSIAIGTKADFVVCIGDPRENISHLRNISLVSVGGRAHDPAVLKAGFDVPGARLRSERRTYVRSLAQNRVE
jgi:imidazolonepropionase-like amidohydrolase